jgi:hypothetical protein
VFSHIIFFVIPEALEVIREERLLGGLSQDPSSRIRGRVDQGPLRTLRQRCRELMKVLVHLGAEGICSAIQYIPLWAVEIARLPDKRARK